MTVKYKLKILIVEPNKKLKTPYSYFRSSVKIHRVISVSQALEKLITIAPDLVFISASFSPSESLTLLEAVVKASSEIIPLMVVVDLSNRINFVPGTSWGRRVAVVDSGTPKNEFFSKLARISQ